ncbi:leucine-rich repeat domain-containing protein [Anaerosporobacter faecicola]|uniref:leucine-rich repeat domain-containing protein n=1 Tax=Anaerosporobacter faecicola TaxID=2718714 RepID=UPI00143B8EBE|nr:leucine-rich repeat domain-containing protein [Anaerosporobacter faecicola]
MLNKYRKLMKSIALFCILSLVIVLVTSHEINATSKPTKGVDMNGNTWTYNKKTKTLTFMGTKDLEENRMDGHSSETDWFCWGEEVEHVVIKEGITGLRGGNFDSFTELKTVVLPDTVTYIGDMTFFSCINLKKITMSKSIEIIGDFTFDGCETLKEIKLSSKVKEIRMGAFSNCSSIVEINIPNSVKKIGGSAFSNCTELKTIKLSKNIKKIEEYLFYGCKNLSKVTIPNSVTTIYAGAFQESGIKQITIPKNVKYIKKGEYGEGLFEGCKNLNKIIVKSKKIKSCFKGAFKGINKKVIIQVPESKLKSYKSMFQKNGLSKKVKIKAIT